MSIEGYRIWVCYTGLDEFSMFVMSWLIAECPEFFEVQS